MKTHLTMLIEFLGRCLLVERPEEVGVEPEEGLGALHHTWAGVHVALQEGIAGANLSLAVHYGRADGVEDSQEVDDAENLFEGQTLGVLGVAVTVQLGILEYQDAQTSCVVGAEADLGKMRVQEAAESGAVADVPQTGEEFKVNANLLGEHVVVQTPDSVGVVLRQQFGNKMIMLLLVITNKRVNLEGCAHLSTADFTVLHLTADSGLAGDGGGEVLDLVLVDDHPHPVGRDVLLGDGDGLDVAVPALDAPLDALRQLPDVLQFLHGLSVVWPHQPGDTDLQPRSLSLNVRMSHYV